MSLRKQFKDVLVNIEKSLLSGDRKLLKQIGLNAVPLIVSRTRTGRGVNRRTKRSEAIKSQHTRTPEYEYYGRGKRNQIAKARNERIDRQIKSYQSRLKQLKGRAPNQRAQIKTAIAKLRARKKQKFGKDLNRALTTPAKNNLTLTGDLLNSIFIKRYGPKFVRLGYKGRDTQRKAAGLQRLGYNWLDLTKAQLRTLRAVANKGTQAQNKRRRRRERIVKANYKYDL